MTGPQGLRSVGLKASYNTSWDDLSRDFFIPLLTQSTSCDRGVGYFTSGWLRENAQGLAEFAVRGGRARWVTSPHLSRQDLTAFSQASELVESPRCLESLFSTVAELKEAIETDTLNVMAWMVADGLLEFRFAVPTGELDGDFHDKFGIFSDETGQRISFLGSYNDTTRGFRNYESIRVFVSWEASTVDAVNEDEQRFVRIWLDQEANLKIFRLPEAVRQCILQHRTDERPYTAPMTYAWQPQGVQLREIIPRDYQQDAIDAWLENSRRGILDMATGTGKTVTALTALSHCGDAGYIVIGAPRRQLVTQWLEVLEQVEGIQPPIEISSNNPGWHDEVLPRKRLEGKSIKRGDDCMTEVRAGWHIQAGNLSVGRRTSRGKIQ